MKLNKDYHAYAPKDWWITDDEDELTIEMFFRDWCDADVILYKDGVVVDNK